VAEGGGVIWSPKKVQGEEILGTKKTLRGRERREKKKGVVDLKPRVGGCSLRFSKGSSLRNVSREKEQRPVNQLSGDEGKGGDVKKKKRYYLYRRPRKKGRWGQFTQRNGKKKKL